MAIKFGTDGWRAIIGEEYTSCNVRLCAQGVADLFKIHEKKSRPLVIGYDTRFRSEEFAAEVAEVSTANGIFTLLANRPSPTPVVSHNLVARNAGGGIIITASHNPAHWNGFKYKPDYGGSASPEVVTELEKLIAKAEESKTVESMPLIEAKRKNLFELFDPQPSYLQHIESLVDLSAIRESGIKIIVDPMFGAGAGYFEKVLKGGSTKIIEIRGDRNHSFPGMTQPEPLAHNLKDLMSTVTSQNADIGIATDGDADRLGIVDETGRYLNTLDVFALLCLHQLDVLGRRGPLVRSITMTSMVDQLGEMYGVPVFDTPVGFKYLGPVMMREDALMAGEESGGYAFRGNIPERDGILSGLILLEMMIKTGKSVSGLLQMLQEKVGPHHYDRWDLKMNESQRKIVETRLETVCPTTLANRQVRKIDPRDGLRFVMDNGCWVLVRFSGTEPLLRLYAEGESAREVAELLKEVRELAGV